MIKKILLYLFLCLSISILPIVLIGTFGGFSGANNINLTQGVFQPFLILFSWFIVDFLFFLSKIKGLKKVIICSFISLLVRLLFSVLIIFALINFTTNFGVLMLFLSIMSIVTWELLLRLSSIKEKTK